MITKKQAKIGSAVKVRYKRGRGKVLHTHAVQYARYSGNGRGYGAGGIMKGDGNSGWKNIPAYWLGGSLEEIVYNMRLFR